MTQGFTFIDLFAGIGGLRQAMESIGGHCVFTSEWDKDARKTYEANYRDNREIAGDIQQKWHGLHGRCIGDLKPTRNYTLYPPFLRTRLICQDISLQPIVDFAFVGRQILNQIRQLPG